MYPLNRCRLRLLWILPPAHWHPHSPPCVSCVWGPRPQRGGLATAGVEANEVSVSPLSSVGPQLNSIWGTLLVNTNAYIRVREGPRVIDGYGASGPSGPSRAPLGKPSHTCVASLYLLCDRDPPQVDTSAETTSTAVAVYKLNSITGNPTTDLDTSTATARNECPGAGQGTCFTVRA